MPNVIGAIRDKWLSLGGPASFLGQPLTDELTTPDGIGRFNAFQGGMIYWTPSTNAHEVHGAILEKWSSLGFERSFLGYPMEDETGTPDGVGQFNRFQGGMIYWTPSTNAHEVYGAILGKWSSLGFERSSLGYPVSDEGNLREAITNGRFNNFEHGQIAWSPASGAHVVQESVTLDSGSITSGLSIGGFARLVMARSGDFTFSGHMHDSGALGIDYLLTIVAMTPSGIAYTVQRSGHTAGTFTPGSRDDDWTISGFKDGIRDNWALEACQAKLSWTLHANDTLTPQIGVALEEALKEAPKQLGQAAVKAVIALL